MLDLSSFTKHDVTEPNAEAFLNRVLANRASHRKVGIVEAYGLSKQGRIESEYTVTRLEDEHFFLLLAAAANICNRDQLNQSTMDAEEVAIKNVTDK